MSFFHTAIQKDFLYFALKRGIINIHILLNLLLEKLNKYKYKTCLSDLLNLCASASAFVPDLSFIYHSID